MLVPCRESQLLEAGPGNARHLPLARHGARVRSDSWSRSRRPRCSTSTVGAKASTALPPRRVFSRRHARVHTTFAAAVAWARTEADFIASITKQKKASTACSQLNLIHHEQDKEVNVLISVVAESSAPAAECIREAAPCHGNGLAEEGIRGRSACSQCTRTLVNAMFTISGGRGKYVQELAPT